MNESTVSESQDSPVLQARGLKVSRGGHVVLSDLSFEVQRGEVFVLLGGNGAGKSTTLLTFLGLLDPDAGEALVFGKSASRDAIAVRERLAFLPENAALYEHLDARQNLRYLLSLAKLERADTDLERALDTVKLPDDARSRKLGSYSKGMRQKVAIALALLREAPVLLLDEPTSGLDPAAIDEFHSLVDTLRRRGVTVLMVTHDLFGACEVKGRVALIRDGSIAEIFDPGSGKATDFESLRSLFVAKDAA